MAKDIDCPLGCPQKFKRNAKSVKSDIQHHLYMAHKMDVIESHKVAERAAKGGA